MKKEAANATVTTFHIEYCIHIGLWFYISCSLLLYFHCDCTHIFFKSYMFMINRNKNVKYMNLIMFDSYSSWRIVTWWYGWVGGGTPWRITWSTTGPWKCSSTSAWCPESHTMWATSTSTSSPSTSPMPRWPVNTMGTSTERWVHLYTKCIMGLAHRVMYIHIVSWACSLREVCKQCNMGMPTERWKLIGVHIQSVLWACPFFDTQRNILFIYT